MRCAVIAPAVLSMPVVVPEPAEYVALGAARQATWTLNGGDCPAWSSVRSVVYEAEPTPTVMERYQDACLLTLGRER